MDERTSARTGNGRQHPAIDTAAGREHEAFLSLVVTAQGLLREVADLVRTQGLTEPQFNALRILRGAGPGGLACSTMADRMLTRVPDITRLVDRMERMGLAGRHRDAETDRRVVRVTLTPRGRATLKRLDQPIRQLHRRQFEHFSQAELDSLIDTLGKVRLP